MKWAYHLEDRFKDEYGHWWPRLVWADGLVTPSCGRIHSSHSLEEARGTVSRWNWGHGISHQDYLDALAACHSRNATLALEEGAEHGVA